MKSIKVLFMFFIMLSLLMTGCNATSVKTNSQKGTELEQLKTENEKLKEQLNSSLLSIQALQNEQNINKNMIDNEKYVWAKEDQWDKILVYKSELPKEKIEIKDKVFMKNIYFDNLMIEQADPTNGAQSDVEAYTYEFIKGDKTYKVNVVGRDIIEYEGKYFNTNKYIYNLGKALLSQPKYIKTDSVLNKIYESGALHGEKEFNYLCISSFRIHGFANVIQDGIDKGTILPVSSNPVNIDEVKEKLTFYYYGQKLYMDVYHNYLSIKDGNKNYWYKIENEFIILSILNAG